jgi:hypothetical protein
MTGALSRLTKDSIVTTNFHSNNVQACPNAPGELALIRAGAIGPDMREKQTIIHRSTLIVWAVR